MPTWDDHLELVIGPRSILFETLAATVGIDADDGINLRIEIAIAAENVYHQWCIL